MAQNDDRVIIVIFRIYGCVCVFLIPNQDTRGNPLVDRFLTVIVVSAAGSGHDFDYFDRILF